MRTSILKIIDNNLGRVVCCLLRPQPSRKFFQPATLLIIRPGGIGDALLLAPAVNLLKMTYPQIRITILAEQRNAGAFPLIPGVDEVLCYDRLREFCRALRGQYDAVIDTEQWYRLSAVVARLIRAPMKIGFDTNERRRMFSHGIHYDQSAYEPDNFLALLKPLGLDFKRHSGTVGLSIPHQSISRASQFLQQLGSGSFVVIFPGSSIPEKCWGAESFSLVAKQLAKKGLEVVIVGGREDRLDGDAIAGAGGLNLVGMTTLTETAAVIARSSLVISGDSGVLHLAAGLGIPTVSLFGPSSVTKWAPVGSNHMVLHKDFTCSPCSKFGTIPTCPIDARCIKDITPDEVMEAIRCLLAQPAGKKKL